MKIKPEQLKAQLKKLSQALPIYLVTGDEPLISGESCDLLRAHLRQQGFTEREVLHADASFSWESTLESANSLSLFAERKIIEIRLGSQKLNKQSSDMLQRYLSNPSPDNALIIIADRMDKSAKQSAWFKKVEDVGLVVEVWPVEVAQLPRWLEQRAAALGLQLNPAAIQLLSDRIEGNLLAAKQELDKLALLYPDTTITEAEITGVVSDSSRFDIFALTDAILAAQSARCQHILQVLKQEGTDATIILWALTREVRTLYRIKRALEQGQNLDQLCQKERIWGKRKNLVGNACRRLSHAALEEMLQKAGRADQAIKGQSRENPWILLSQITLAFSGVKNYQL